MYPIQPWIHFLIFRLFSFLTFTLADIQYRRTPPFGITTDSNKPSQHLGDYTHSHETVDKSTYSCHPIGECEQCTPLEKVNLKIT